MYRIGIDVGGTNTDAAILDENMNVIHALKEPTTKDVESGIFNALKRVVHESRIDCSKIQYAVVGTTHCTNAIVERKRLNKIGYIRICKPSTTAIPPFADWPQDLVDEINVHSEMISGGYEFDGRKISNLNKEEVKNFCEVVKGKVTSIAVCGVFSPVNKEQEEQVADWIREYLGNIHISLSNEIGSIGILERENATILNSALVTTGQMVVNGFKKSLETMDINCPIYFSQNDGTLMNLEYTLKYPIFTIGCGPTNSIRGAAFLSGIKDALVLDVGGTTSDFGVLSNGFPRQSSLPASIGGVRTNFRMPDILSIGLGGGTRVRNNNDEITVGPDSVGYELNTESLIFGGKKLTLSDIVTKLGKAFEDKKDKVKNLSSEVCEKVYEIIKDKLEDGIDLMKTSSEKVPLILVGGGSIIVPEKLNGVSEIIRPKYYGAANAIGAALGQVSGSVEKVYKLDSISRKDAINDAAEIAKKRAFLAGADEKTLEILTIEDVPLSYLPGNAVLIKIKVVGDLK
jgi:N-methylhydantoinase A/oxoprolinase/acetone carboxylase beta subunit